MNPIGVLGGIFDPVHNGHLAVASLAKEFFKLDKVLLVPSGTPPHKKSTVTCSAFHRNEMLLQAIADEPGFDIWDHEIKRDGISYTVDTIHELKETFENPIYFIIGSDNLKEIVTWYKYEEILKLVTLCVAHRPGYSCELPLQISNANIKSFPSPEWGISSTMIRKYLREGYSCRHLLPPRVINYIFDMGFYKN
ncbi:MAG: nicotinate-nucleotide adenylyltransferase [Fibrobacter sp.]|nr:nicotinate-nucleotide adenylyltransferase [Fibrobacter sp.]